MAKTLFILLSVFYVALSLNCLDNSGNSVPWLTFIKPPQVAYAPPLPGKSYSFLTPNHMTAEIESQPLNVSSPITYTLNQFNTDSSISVLFYNDGVPPNSTNYNNYVGHTKGILAYTSTQAIYIIHSFPNFPYYNSTTGKVMLDIFQSETYYGQNLMCLQISPQTLFNLAGLMTINKPQVYYSRIITPNSNITLLVQNQTTLQASTVSYSFSVDGNTFTYLARSAAANLDFWEDVVSKYYKDSFYVQSWGRPYMPGYCPPDEAYTNLNVDELTIKKYWWYGYDDHSKWGIAVGQTVLCYADINRMYSQASRGGGGVCTNFPSLYTVHKAIVETTDPCGQTFVGKKLQEINN
ncbi:DNASE2B_2 [Blepharisma stoltei]|uniref:Uncharacterized protein n=1 Tax=Blepharisma stoltei TaxID=1481888 RepID=A0AAU9JP59_9CILI|nr:unnamed protein product [Blepharisma stoltei]